MIEPRIASHHRLDNPASGAAHTDQPRFSITRKITETASEQLRSEWQENIQNNELKVAKLEREPKIHINDLDLALILLSRVGELFVCLDDKQKSKLLQI